MKVSVKRLIFFLMAAVLATGCATNKLESRKKQRASAYASFSPEIKQAVDQGRITVGMPEQAVYIAWGKPAQVLQHANEQGAYTVWLYEGAFLEQTPYWAHRWAGGRHNDIEPYATMTYMPHAYPSAEVIFVNGVVKQWRTLPKPAY